MANYLNKISRTALDAKCASAEQQTGQLNMSAV